MGLWPCGDKGLVHLSGAVPVNIGASTRVSLTVAAIRLVDGYSLGKLDARHIVSQRLSRLRLPAVFDECRIFEALQFTERLPENWAPR